MIFFRKNPLSTIRICRKNFIQSNQNFMLLLLSLRRRIKYDIMYVTTRRLIKLFKHYMCETWVAAQPTLKIAANVLYETVSTIVEKDERSLQGIQPPKTEEKETATKIAPAPCHILKCPNLSIYQVNEQKLLPQVKRK